MTSQERDPELDAVARELSEVLRELRWELRRQSRGPFGMMPVPSPRELLSFTERRAIPAAISVLELNIRALEVLAAAARLGEKQPTNRTSRDDRLRSSPVSVDRTTLEQLDDALVNLRDALEGDRASPEARRLIEEARDLRDEVDDRLREFTSGQSTISGTRPNDRSMTHRRTDTRPAGDRDSGENATHSVPVDVEDELETIKRDVEEEEQR